MNFREFLMFSEATHESKGILRYGHGIRISVWLDRNDEIAQYYKSLIPKAKYVKPQMYAPHITVVRSGKENPDMKLWRKSKDNNEGELVHFTYNTEIQSDALYYYLNIESDRIGELRREMGLPTYRFDDNKKYHLTIGNVKA